MPTVRLSLPRGAALVTLAGLAVTGCAKEGAAPGTGAAPAAQAQASRSAPPPTAPAAVPSDARGPTAGIPPAAAPAPSAAPSAAAAPVTVPAEAAAAPEITLEQVQRRSPSAALVETFNAACAEPSRGAVARAAKRLEFTPVTTAARREASGGAASAVPESAEAWRGPDEVGGALLLWHAETATCELRADGVDLLLVESAFSRLPQTLEDEGSSVMRLAPPSALAGGVRTRQVLLVQPGRFSRPERARVLRFGHHLSVRGSGATEASGDTVTLSARSVSAPR